MRVAHEGGTQGWHMRSLSSPCSCEKHSAVVLGLISLCCPGEQEPSCPKSICGGAAPSAPGSLQSAQCAFPDFAHAHPWLSPVPDRVSSPWERTGLALALPGLGPCPAQHRAQTPLDQERCCWHWGSVFFHAGSPTLIKRAIKSFVLLQCKLQPTPSSCPVPLIKSVYVKCCEPKQRLIAK